MVFVMKRLNLIIAAVFTMLYASALFSTSVNAQGSADNPFYNCALPSVDERGPIRPSLYVVGTFPEGQWIQQENRKMLYKGNGIYQLVIDENAGNLSVQFATMSWNPQFTAAGLELTVGQVKDLKRAGFAKNTAVTLPVAGRYVWTVKIAEDKKPLQVAVAQCK